MAVYVDDMRSLTEASRRDTAESHLFADSDEELHAFAARLGLTVQCFVPGRHPRIGHYHVTPGKRQQAIMLGATPVTRREAGQITRAQADKARAASERASRKRHRWDRHDNHHKTCRDCGITAVTRPHPCERRWYQQYTTAGGQTFTAGRVPPCAPAVHPQSGTEEERAGLASVLDRAAGRAWQQGDLQSAAQLIADARTLDPSRAGLWDQREAAIAAAAPRPGRSRPPDPAGRWHTCSAPHPHQDAYLAARRSAEVAGTGRCHDGHPVSDLAQEISMRLTAAGFTASSPGLARIRAWNRTAMQRAGFTRLHDDGQTETS